MNKKINVEHYPNIYYRTNKNSSRLRAVFYTKICFFESGAGNTIRLRIGIDLLLITNAPSTANRGPYDVTL